MVWIPGCGGAWTVVHVQLCTLHGRVWSVGCRRAASDSRSRAWSWERHGFSRAFSFRLRL